MKGDRLYDVIEFILNEASEQELEVVHSALKRRVEGGRQKGAMGVDPGRIARRAAAGIREQMGLSVDSIRSMVSKYAAEIIRKNAPELSEEQVRELLDSWVSPQSSGDASAPRRQSGGNAAPADETEGASAGHSPQTGRRSTRLAPDVILTMVTQFLSYSDESMSISEQVRLNQEIPDWQKRYWEQFSPRIRELLSIHLRGQIDRKTCLERICADLGIDADLSG